MLWVDYTIDQAGPNFTIKGDWPGEVMGWSENGSEKQKENTLYQPGDRFIVNEKGWFIRCNPEDEKARAKES